jgi:hypothetical protein
MVVSKQCERMFSYIFVSWTLCLIVYLVAQDSDISTIIHPCQRDNTQLFWSRCCIELGVGIINNNASLTLWTTNIKINRRPDLEMKTDWKQGLSMYSPLTIHISDAFVVGCVMLNYHWRRELDLCVRRRWIWTGFKCPFSRAAMAAWASPGLIPAKATAWSLRFELVLWSVWRTDGYCLHSGGKVLVFIFSAKHSHCSLLIEGLVLSSMSHTVTTKTAHTTQINKMRTMIRIHSITRRYQLQNVYRNE